MKQKYTFLFAPLDAVGHINACTGIAEQLLNRGHKVVFVTPSTWKGKLEKLGFVEELLENEDTAVKSEVSQQDSAGDNFAKLVAKFANIARLPSIERHETLHLQLYKDCFEEVKSNHARLQGIMNDVKPDAVVVDQLLHIPALMNDDVPWVSLLSCNPIIISKVNVPPADSGYSTDSDRTLWEIYDQKAKEVYNDLFRDIEKWIRQNGGPEFELEYGYLIKDSPWANIYMYPIELDYTSLRPNPPNWHRFDALVRNTEGSFEIPEKLKAGPGKLVYFSMGTIGSADIDLMKRLLKILAKSPNRFIVSKGPCGDKTDLADNMWGLNNVPQTRVIPLVDLIMTHGGNNTVTECFYFGKRLLVLGMLWDQLDNAQRVHETGLGLRCHPYEVTEEELLASIEQLLQDDLLERRMTSIGKRIRSTNSQSAAADLVESVAANNCIN